MPRKPSRAPRPKPKSGFAELEDSGLKRLSDPGTIIVQKLSGEVYIFPEQMVRAAQVRSARELKGWRDALLGFAHQVVNLRTAILVAAPDDKRTSKFVICRDGR